MYRDDRQALLERIDALEQELAELRPRVARLQEENTRLRALVPPSPSPALTERVLRLRVTGHAFERVYTYDQDVIKIGRLPSAHLQLDHPSISRMHAVIERGEGWTIVDLGSTEGVEVNGAKVAKQTLGKGDAIRIGPFTLEVI